MILRGAGVFILGAGLMHITMGLQADQLLGAQVSAQSLTDAGLDSQNRFYGATFTLYGVLLWMISSQLARYAQILKALLWVFLLAGLARCISVALFGWPPLWIGLLFAAEIVFPPLLLIWLAQLSRQFTQPDAANQELHAPDR